MKIDSKNCAEHFPKNRNPSQAKGRRLHNMKIRSRCPNDTLELARGIARKLRPGDIVCLSGPLGAGKTVFAKGIAAGLGISRERVISPSFVLIRQYPGPEFPLYHFDLYRLGEPENILDLGYEEYLYGEGVTVIEWAERLKYLLPKEYLRVKLYIESDKCRLLEFTARGRRYREVLPGAENLRPAVRALSRKGRHAYIRH